MRLKLIYLPAALSLVLLLVAMARPALAANQVVNNCSNDSELRSDLTAMQSSGGGTLTFNCGTMTIVLSGGVLPSITTHTIVDGGNKITLSGNDTWRVFQVNPGGRLELAKIILEKGYMNGDGGAINNLGLLTLDQTTIRNSNAVVDGGAIASLDTVEINDSKLLNNKGRNGGAIYGYSVNSHLKITDSQLKGNRATGSSPNGLGGAIISQGAVNIYGSEFANNGASAGGALYAHSSNANVTIVSSVFHDNSASTTSQTEGGGALWIANQSHTQVSSSVFSKNKVDPGKGGAIFNTATLTLSDVMLTENAAMDTSPGGAIFNYGTLTMDRSTLNRNSAYYGGGINNAFAVMALTNVTFSGNAAQVVGGGIYNLSGTANLINVTFSGNSAGTAGGIRNESASTLTLKNVLLANSPNGGNCSFSQAPAILTNNLSSDASCNFGVGRDNLKLKLGPLETNGGATLTHRLLPGSPAIDSGSGSGAPATDQRNILRPQGGTVDVGAFEFQPCTGVPQKPLALTPAKKAIVTTSQAVLDWAGPDCVAKFSVTLRSDSKHGPVVWSKNKVKNTQVTTPALARNKKYVWQVTACSQDNCAVSGWSQFKTGH